MPRREQCRVDARPWVCLGRALVDRGRAALGLPAAQRPRADAREAARRRDQIFVARRDRCPQPGLPPVFPRDLAHLGILGEQGRRWPSPDPPRRRPRPPAKGLTPTAVIARSAATKQSRWSERTWREIASLRSQ